MTIEHRIVVGWGDVQGVVFECSTCGARIAVQPKDELDKKEPVDKCPNGHSWSDPGQSVNRTFGALKQQMSDGDKKFRVRLQFDEPTPDSPRPAPAKQ